MTPLAGIIDSRFMADDTVIRLIQGLLGMVAPSTNCGVPDRFQGQRPSWIIMPQGHDHFALVAILAILGDSVAAATVLGKTQEIPGMGKFIVRGVDLLFKLGLGMATFTVGLLVAAAAIVVRATRRKTVHLNPTEAMVGG